MALWRYCPGFLKFSFKSANDYFKVVVNNAPNLGDPEERQRIRSMVHAFANTRHTIGNESVQFWMKEMEWYYSDPKHGIAGEGFDMSNVTSDETFYWLAKVSLKNKISYKHLFWLNYFLDK